MNRLGLRLVLLFLVSLALSSGCFSTARADEIAAFVKTHCVDCHNETTREGGLRLDGLSLDPAVIGASADALRVKELLPEDGQQFGFDKVAGALDISHIQMTKYLQTADTALRQAIVREP